MFKKIIKVLKIKSYKIILETGEIAKKTSSSVKITVNNTIVLVTVVNNLQKIKKKNFFPLTINYIEKLYSIGKIPGGFFKREGKPSEREIIISRLIDRLIRPLFPKNFFNKIQIIIHTLSVDKENDPDILAAIGVSVAISISGIPFKESIATIRIGYINNKFILNPTISELKFSKLNLILSGTKKKILMLEAISKEISEKKILKAITFGQKKIKIIIDFINKFKKKVNKKKINWKPENKYKIFKIKNLIKYKLKNIYKIDNLLLNNNKLNLIKKKIFLSLNKIEKKKIKEINNFYLKTIFKKNKNKIFNGNSRIDKRGIMDIRPINIKTSILPRTHGSILFTKGETQALVITTLGSSKDEQKIETSLGEHSERFMLHYNMLPFATGEINKINFPKRREIGHGYLAKRALINSLPNIKNFNYSIRIVSEITESNGSSSMASVCGGSLALVNAGVPIKNYVAGIAIGLIRNKKKNIILSDILGKEDQLGILDFKITRTIKGITALQMDIKTTGITKKNIFRVLMQAKENLLKILKKMENSLSIKKIKLSKFAPHLIKFKINPKNIKNIIGKGGSIIKNIIQKTKTNIDISNEGIITILSIDKKTGQNAKKKIEILTKSIKIGEFYKGTVIKILEFGAIVQIIPGKDGLLHINQITNKKKKSIKDFLKKGQIIKIKVINCDNKGRLKFSMKKKKY
ncbi:polyribonucleotide nucleotidyltransferase [Candidatus Zinderia endosymbiont of Aphrophora alni]|uniref:polyribonucleotide nucleotidyltransferase n=1 Tax=Candidatus Zinderia endosymbiont of Aphrophora alni TaxID=3077951 RepID=UPI0030CD7845